MYHDEIAMFVYPKSHLLFFALFGLMALLMFVVGVLLLKDSQSLPVYGVVVVFLLALVFAVWSRHFLITHRRTEVRISPDSIAIGMGNERVVQVRQIVQMDYGSRPVALLFPGFCMDPIIRLYTHDGTIDLPRALVHAENGTFIGSVLMDMLGEHRLTANVIENAEFIAKGLPLRQTRALRNAARR